MWCEKTFFPAHGEEEFTSSDYSASPANLVIQWKKGVKKIRTAWSNECAGMRRNYTDHDWDSLWEILPTDLVGTIWNGKLIALAYLGHPMQLGPGERCFQIFHAYLFSRWIMQDCISRLKCVILPVDKFTIRFNSLILVNASAIMNQQWTIQDLLIQVYVNFYIHKFF